MKQSETIGKLATALADVQKNLRPAVINAQNPHLHNKYADLNSIMSSCRDLLADNGLSFVQLPTATPIELGPGVGLTTMLMHDSGEWLQDTFYLPVNPQKGVSLPQVTGSIITYARRYALAAMLGIVTDEDTDGYQKQNGQGTTKKKPPPKVVQKVNADLGLDKSQTEHAQANTNGLPKHPPRFIDYCIDTIPRYDNVHAVKGALKLLGYSGVKQDDTERERQYLALQLYANARDAGKGADEALAYVDQAMNETEAT